MALYSRTVLYSAVVMPVFEEEVAVRLLNCTIHEFESGSHRF